MSKKKFYITSGLIISIIVGIGIGRLYSEMKHSDYQYQSRINALTAPCIESSRVCYRNARLCETELSNQVDDGPSCANAQAVCAKANRVCTNVLSELDDLNHVYGITDETMQKP